MDEREQQRKVRHRLGVLRHAEEFSGNVSATCRYCGISRPTFYKWLHRYEELGEDGVRDGSSRPFNSPNATQAEIAGGLVLGGVMWASAVQGPWRVRSVAVPRTS